MYVPLIDVDVRSESAGAVVTVEANLRVTERATTGLTVLALATGDDRLTASKVESQEGVLSRRD